MIPVDRGVSAAAVLFALGALSGIASMVAVARLSDMASLRMLVNRWIAHLMELQLFSDDPGLVFRAQRNLLAANWGILRAVAKPLLVMLLPLAALFVAGEAYFGSAPVSPGEFFVVTARFDRASPLNNAAIFVPVGFRAETEGVRIPRVSEVSWRLQALAPASGQLLLRTAKGVFTKSIAAGLGWHWLSPVRTRAFGIFLHPFEIPLTTGPVESIAVQYRPATVLRAPWFLWMLLGSLAGAAIAPLLRLNRSTLLAAGMLALITTTAHADTASPLFAKGYTVMPQPQQVSLTGRDVRIDANWHLAATGNNGTAEELRDRFQERAGIALKTGGSSDHRIELRLSPGSVQPTGINSQDRENIAAQAYRLQIGPDRITITANAHAGLFYGVETLAQLLTRRNEAVWVPEGEIIDWPDLALRHMYWDDAHHLEKLDFLKDAIRDAAFVKMNGFVLKLEGHFQYRSAPALVEPQALSPAQLQELTDYGLKYHVEVIPYLDAPAHIAFILKHPEYAPLRAFPDSNYEMCAVNPKGIRLLEGMYQDLMDANKGAKHFYLSTDEAYYIGWANNPACDEKAQAYRLGSRGKLLAQFVTQTASYLHDHGRSVMFWGEYPLKPADISSLPSYLINGESYGDVFDPVFRQHGIRQMAYTAIEGEERLFPHYYLVPPSKRLHPLYEDFPRLPEAMQTIASVEEKKQADLIGAIVAGWGDMGLHPETFWLGYATVGSAEWRQWSAGPSEAMATFYRLWNGPSTLNIGHLYQLMSTQAQVWNDSWDTVDSKVRPGIWGDSNEIFSGRKPAHDQSIALLPVPSNSLGYQSAWRRENAERLRLTGEATSDNDALLALLGENLQRAELHRYGLEVFLSIAQVYRQNLDFFAGLAQLDQALDDANTAARAGKTEEALSSVDGALALVRSMKSQRDNALQGCVETWGKSWLPKTAEANGRRFLHQVDDVKDHLPDRTVDMSYLIYRELMLPMDDWYENTEAARNAYARAHHLPERHTLLHWKSY